MTRSALPAAAEQRRGPPDHRGARFASFTGQSYDASTRTVEAVLSLGVRVRRWFGFEELAITADAVDLSRVAMGQVRLLDCHNQWEMNAVLGVVESARIEGNSLVGTLRFADTDSGRAAEGMVSRGELTGISIGYGVSRWQMVEITDHDDEVWRATAWELLEVSLVPVPADPNAGVRSAAPTPSDQAVPTSGGAEEDPDMTRSVDPAAAPAAAPAAPAAPVEPAARAADPAPAAPAAPAVPVSDASAARMSASEALTFAADARSFGVEDAQVRTWVETLTPDAARSELLRVAAERQRGEAPRPAAGEGARVTVDARDRTRSAVSLALLHRFDPDRHQLEGDVGAGAREWSGMSLLEIGRRNLEANGVRVAGLGRRELASAMLGFHPDGSRAHSTSDFPYILAGVTGRTLRDGYESAPQTFRGWMRRATAPDFKQVTRLQLGGAPSFLVVPEGGEFKMGTIGEAKEVYSLATYGRRFSITRQTIINDDLDAFSRIPTMFGRAAADFESDAAYAPVIANPTMGDGVALFHASHGNLAGSGAAPAEGTLAAGQQAMGEQTGLEGRYINIQPRHLIVGWKDAVTSQKLLTSVQATATSGVNPFANKLNLIVEARLKASPQPWFMAADYAQVDTFEYAYLEGEEGVYLEERQGFEVDGIEFKARTDFAVKAIDHRGVYKNPGV